VLNDDSPDLVSFAELSGAWWAIPQSRYLNGNLHDSCPITNLGTGKSWAGAGTLRLIAEIQ
jgi:hypothetical protein